MNRKAHGFTIVELLIVIVVIAILAAISIAAYNGIQQRARAVSLQSNITQIHKLIELYYAEHGEYPKTTASALVSGPSGTSPWTDSNCAVGNARSDWVPGIGVIPQSDQSTRGATDKPGCYMYVSDGEKYILTAWNLLESPQTGTLYRRVGFRESDRTPQQYYCNHSGTISGIIGGVYLASRDFYKYSYTFSNVTNCDGTPPAGA